MGHPGRRRSSEPGRARTAHDARQGSPLGPDRQMILDDWMILDVLFLSSGVASSSPLVYGCEADAIGSQVAVPIASASTTNKAALLYSKENLYATSELTSLLFIYFCDGGTAVL